MEICTTDGVTVSVISQYLPDQSEPKAHKYIFGYHIRIDNGSPYTVQLLRRHWTIIDAHGVVREVEGEGVVGRQPVLHPGESHEYISFCNLFTEIGKMYGSYLMKRLDDETTFRVTIPEFKMFCPIKFN